MPCSFSQLRGRLLGILARCKQVHRNEYFTIFRVLELFWELRTVRYPDDLLHKLVFSIPASLVAQRLRFVVTTWLGFSDTQARQCDSSISPRSSCTGRTEEKIIKARRLLLRHDSEYQAYTQMQLERAEKARVVALGRILAVALKPALVSAMTGFITT